MKVLLAGCTQKLIAAAATVTGKKFGLLVATSLIATTGVVSAALHGSNGVNPLAAAAVAALLEKPPAAVATSAPTPAPEESIASPTASEPEPAPEASTSEPLPESVPATAPESLPSSAPETSEPPAPPSEPELPEAGPIKHVFLISLASPGYDAAFGAAAQMPYLSGTLRPQGVLLTNYSLLDPASLPNSFAAIGGQPPTADTKADCPAYEKCLFSVETLTLVDQLGPARLTWHAYLEDMADPEGKPANCVHPESGATEAPAPGAYSATSNPFVYFHSLLDLGDCATNDVPLSELPKDLKKADKTASFSYIAPNQCNAGFRGECPEGTADGPAAADAWLEKTTKEILASPAYKKDGLLIVSFGALDPAAEQEAAAAGVTDPLKVGALIVSPLLTPNGTDGAAYTPYSLLRSTDELFGLEPLAEAGGKKVHSFASTFIAGETAAGD